jgi:hypothetical protein
MALGICAQDLVESRSGAAGCVGVRFPAFGAVATRKILPHRALPVVEAARRPAHLAQRRQPAQEQIVTPGRGLGRLQGLRLVAREEDAYIAPERRSGERLGLIAAALGERPAIGRHVVVGDRLRVPDQDELACTPSLGPLRLVRPGQPTRRDATRL